MLIVLLTVWILFLFVLLTVWRLFANIANNLLLRLLDSFAPYHLLDGPPVIFRHVEVYDHVALLVVLMTPPADGRAKAVCRHRPGG